MTRIRIVAGANFGDEGKGLMTSWFAEKAQGPCLVALSNGGAQRGHTVVKDGFRHVFSHFGSGTMEGADTYFPEEFIVNPLIFMREYRELKARSADLWGAKIYIHPNCRVTTPYEMAANLILEEHRGEKRHGSVGIGIWETVIGEGIRFGELTGMTREEAYRYLTVNRRERTLVRLRQQGVEDPGEDWKEILEGDGMAETFLSELAEMKALVIPADDRLLLNYPDIIFENGQGLLLDRRMKWKGFGDHTTPSNTGVRNPAAVIMAAFGEEDGPWPEIEAVYVTRTYMTRHGAGRFDTECPVEALNPEIRDLTNMPNASQGSIRYGTLNYRSLTRRIRRDFRELSEKLGQSEKEMRASLAVALTHLNEYPAAWENSSLIKYKSGGEAGPDRVILKET